MGDLNLGPTGWFMLQLLFRFSVFLLAIASLLFGTSGCSVKEKELDEPLIDKIEEPRVQSVPQSDQALESVDLKRVYFEFDSAQLREEGKQVLRANARWLKKHPSARIQVEGRCDERGSDEYNLKLGKRRADAAKRFLVGLGIAPQRISTLSIGAVSGASDSQRARNRNAAGTIVYFSN